MMRQKSKENKIHFKFHRPARNTRNYTTLTSREDQLLSLILFANVHLPFSTTPHPSLSDLRLPIYSPSLFLPRPSPSSQLYLGQLPQHRPDELVHEPRTPYPPPSPLSLLKRPCEQGKIKGRSGRWRWSCCSMGLGRSG